MASPEKISEAKNERQKEVARERTFHAELFEQLLTLATAGFGLAAALAWNDTIQSVMKEYIEPRVPGSGIVSRLLYALVVTFVAVFITYQLARLSARFSRKED